MRIRRAYVVISALVAALFLVLPAPAAGQAVTGEYRVGPRDLLVVSVVEVPEVAGERRVSDMGTLDLPVLGPVNVGGLTPSEIQDRVSALLTAKFVNRATVIVSIKEYASKPVWIGGAVARPGPLGISGRWDLQQAILAAGGLGEKVGRKIYVMRRASNGLSDRLTISVDDLFTRLSETWNVPIFPGDIVTVTPRVPVRITCLGEFKSPGVVEFPDDENVTLLNLIARTGGLSERASRGKIRVKRKNQDGGEVEVFYNYSRIVSGKDPDPELETGDVVIVKESLL